MVALLVLFSCLGLIGLFYSNIEPHRQPHSFKQQFLLAGVEATPQAIKVCVDKSACDQGTVVGGWANSLQFKGGMLRNRR